MKLLKGLLGIGGRFLFFGLGILFLIRRLALLWLNQKISLFPWIWFGLEINKLAGGIVCLPKGI